MGFYVSKDGFYVSSTLDTNTNIYLTRKGKMYTHYSIKIQRWWRRIAKNKVENQAALKIQNWWRQNRKMKFNLESEETSILILPLFIINKLVRFFRYLFV